jgi:ATP-dependent Clp endopeptidase proteolytic subunit ClpP
MNYSLKSNQHTKFNNDSDEEDTVSETDTINVNGNKVIFHAEVTKETCFKLIECLEKAKKNVCVDFVNDEFAVMGVIYLYINSDGGDLFAALAVIDRLLSSKVDIITVCEGCVASAGTLISLAGKQRYIRANSYMLIHELRSGCLGKYSECQDDMKNNDILMKQLKTYMNERCNNNKLKKKLVKVLKHDNIWRADKCLKYGLVDKII